MAHSDREERYSRALVSIVLAASLLILLYGIRAHAGPEGEQVIRGDVEFMRDGNTTVIEASNNSIINYTGFDILPRETVQFVQPGVNARVLNRVLSADPTRIAGTLRANGIVYIVNPAGVYFVNGCLVDVGRIYAAAGNISNSDFLNNVNRFSEVSGAVMNYGTIRGQAVNLIGRQVGNYGSIVADNGMVTLAAGDEVYIGELGGYFMAKVEGIGPASAAALSDTPAVENAGSIAARDGVVYLGAGDMYSLAVRNTGDIAAGDIRIEGGDEGIVSISGSLDASSDMTGEGRGGSITILGDKVGLFGADIDASGENGGGTVLLGGGYQGAEASLRNASRTYVSADSTINADAVNEGDGGTIVIWSDELTAFFGNISARGGAASGDGGFAEVSGGRQLDFYGLANLGADSGAAGTLLLDPLNITVVDNATGGKTDLVGSVGDDSQANVYAFTEDPADSTNLEVQAITDQLAVPANVTLQATNDIIVNSVIDVSGTAAATGSSLTFQAGNDITVNSGKTITLRGGAIAFTANDSGGTQSGSGSISINAALDTTGGGQPAAAVTLTLDGGTGSVDLGAPITGTVTGAADTVNILNDTASIQDGVDIVNADGTIQIAGGTYGEAVSWSKNLAFTVPAGTAAANSWTSTGGATITTLSGELAATGAFSFAGPVVLGGATTLTAGGTIGFADTLGAVGFDLVLAADEIDFDGVADSVSGTGAITLQPAQIGTSIGIAGGAGTLDLAAADIGSLADGFSSITIGRSDGTGAIDVSAVTFLDPVTIRAPDGGSIAVNGELSAPSAALLAGTGTVDLAADVVGTVSGSAAAVDVQSSSARIQDAVNIVNADGTIELAADTYGEDVSWSQNLAFTVPAGTAVANSWTSTGGATTTTLSGQFEATGAFSFAGPVLLGGATTLTADSLTFNGTVNGAQDLVLAVAGTTSINVEVGGTQPLASLVTEAGGTTEVGANISAQGSTLTFNDPVTLTANAVFADSGGGVIFNSSLAGAGYDVTVEADEIDFDGVAGSVSGTGALTLQPAQVATSIGIYGGAGDLDLAAADIDSLADGFSSITIGRSDGQHAVNVNAVTFLDPVTLRAPDGGSIAVNGQLTAPSATLLAGTGTVDLGADVTGTVSGSAATVDVLNNSASIQDGVNIVSAGGTVNVVGSGTYTESVTIPKSLSLIGLRTDGTTDAWTVNTAGAHAEAPTVTDSAGHIITVNSDDVAIRGLVIDTNGAASQGIEANGSGLTAEYNTFTFDETGGDVALSFNPLSNDNTYSDIAINYNFFDMAVGTTVHRAMKFGNVNNLDVTYNIIESRIEFVVGGDDVICGVGDVNIYANTFTPFDGAGIMFIRDFSDAGGADGTLDNIIIQQNLFDDRNPGIYFYDDSGDSAGTLVDANFNNITVTENYFSNSGVPPTIDAIYVGETGSDLGVTIDAENNYWDHNKGPTWQGGPPDRGENIVVNTPNTTVDYGPYWTNINDAFGPGTYNGDEGGPVFNVDLTVYYGEIQDAIDAATAGHELWIDSGSYSEDVSWAIDLIFTVLTGTATADSWTSTGGATTTTLSGAFGATGAFSFAGPVILGGTTTLTAGTTAGFATVTGNHNLVLAVTGTTTFAGAVGGTGVATDLIGDGAGAAITINSDGLTDFQSTVRTAGGITIDAAGNTEFDGAVTSAAAITQVDDAAGAVTFRDTVTIAAGDSVFGGDVVLDGMTFNSGGAVTFGSADMDGDTLDTSTALVTVDTTANNSQVEINSATTLGSGLTINAGSGRIQLDGTVDGNSALALNTTGVTDINGEIGSGPAVASVTTNPGGTTEVGADISAQGATITFNDPVTLTANTVFSDTGGGVIFNSSLTGAGYDITMEADEIDFGGAVSGTGALTLQPAQVGTSIGIYGGAGTLDLAAADIDWLADGFSSITIGRSDGIGAINVSAVAFTDPVTILTSGAGSIAVNGQITGSGNASVALTGPTTLNADVVTANQAIMITGNATLGTPATITLDSTNGTPAAAGGDITVTGTIDDDVADTSSLALVAGTSGDIDLQSAVGGTAVTGLAATGDNITLTGVTTTVGGTGVTAVSQSDITINAPVNSGGAVSLSGTGGDDTIDVNDNVTAATTLTIQNAAVVDLAESVDLATTNGALSAATGVGSINLSGGSATTNTIDGNGGQPVTLADLTDTNNPNLTVTSEGGLALAGADLGSGTHSFTADGTLSVNGGFSGGAVTLSGVGGDETIDVNADLAASSTLVIQNAGLVDIATVPVSITAAGLTVNPAVSGAQNLTLNVGPGATTFVETVNVGSGTGASIAINSAGTTEFQKAVTTASGITQAGAAGTVTFRENATLAAGNTASTFNADVVLDGMAFNSGGAVTFGSDAGDTLTLSTGDVTILANGLTVNSLVTGAQNLALAVGPAATTFAAPVSVGSGTGASIAISSAGTTQFQDTVTTATGITQAGAAGAVTFRETVTVAGGGTASVFDANAVLDGMNFNSAGAVTFGTAGGADTLTLSGGPVNITATGLTVNSAVSGAQNLGLNVSGATTFAETVNVGSGTGASIAINSAGTTEFQDTVATASGITQANAAGAVTFQENVTVSGGGTASAFDGNVVLGGMNFNSAGAVRFGTAAGGDTLTLSGGPVGISATGLTVNSAVSGAQNLALAVGPGATTFAETVSVGSGVGASLAISSTGTTEFQDTVTTASGITQAGAAGAVTFRENVTVSGGGTASAFDANVVLDGMNFNSAGAVTFGTASSDALTVSGGPVTIATTNQAVDINSTTALNSNLAINAGSGLIRLDGALSGAGDLSLNTTGQAAITADVSAGAISIQNAATLDLAGNVDLTATGALDASTVGSINLSGGNTTTNTINADGISLATLTDTNNPDLTVTSAGGMTLAGADLGTGAHEFTADGTLAVNGAFSGGAVTFSGVGGDDTIDINGNVTAASALTIENAAVADVAGNVSANALNLRDGVTFVVGGTANVSGATTLRNGTNFTFGSLLTTNSLSTNDTCVNIALNGGGTVTTDTNFLNTGTLALGDDAADAVTFNNGLDTSNGPSVTNVAGAVRTTADPINMGTLALTADSTIDSTNNGGSAVGGRVTLEGEVTSPGVGETHSLTVRGGTGGDVEFQAAVGAGASNALNDLTVTGANIGLQNVTTIGSQSYALSVVNNGFVEFGSLAGAGSTSTYAAGGNILLNTNRGRIPRVATAYLTNGDLVINCADFRMTQLDKLTVCRGDLLITATGTARLGDLNALDNINVSAVGPIVLLARGPGAILTSQKDAYGNFMTAIDSGLDFVAGNAIFFNKVPIGFGLFATPTGAGSVPGNPIASFDVPVTEGNLISGTTVFDLSAEGPPIGTNPAVFNVALVTPYAASPAAVDAALRELLARLGIYAIDETGEQFIEFLVGRALYDNIPTTLTPRPWDHQVSSGRLSSIWAREAVDTYMALFLKPRIDPATGRQAVGEDGRPLWESRVGDLVGAVQAALDRYLGKNEIASTTAVEFYDYLAAEPAESEARDVVLQMNKLLREIRMLGLTGVEYGISRSVLLREFTLRGMRRAEVIALMEGIRPGVLDLLIRLGVDTVDTRGRQLSGLLPADWAQDVARNYSGLFLEGEGRLAEMARALQASLNRYAAIADTTAAGGEAFREYAETQPGEEDAISILRELDTLFGQIANLGLSEIEYTYAGKAILGQFGLRGISQSELIKAVRPE